MIKRFLSQIEIDFLKRILMNTDEARCFIKNINQYMVEEMDDGGMGSLKFISDNKDRVFYRELIEVRFIDVDNIDVISTINLDNYGDIYELDMWKVDFSRLKRIPTDDVRIEIIK